MTPKEMNRAIEITERLKVLADRERGLIYNLKEKSQSSSTVKLGSGSILLTKGDSPELFEVIINMAFSRIDTERKRLNLEMEAL